MTNQKIILVTGGTSGIGRETVKGLASTGATIVFTARDIKKGEDTKREIRNETGNNSVEYLMCDLASFPSIRECVEEFKKRYQRLDVLINNAGVLSQERQESIDGINLILQLIIWRRSYSPTCSYLYSNKALRRES